MLGAFIFQNFATLLLITAIVVIMFVNKKYNIPATDLFFLSIALLLIIMVFDTVETLCENNDSILSLDLQGRVALRNFAAAVQFILRPFVIMIEIMIIIPSSVKLKPLSAIPAVINLVVYSTAFTGSEIAYTITPDNHFSRGPLGTTVFFVQIFYVIELMVISVRYFRNLTNGKNAIVILILTQVAITTVLEYMDLVTGFSNFITALAILEYYIYLSVIYQEDMRNTIVEKDLELEKEKMLLLRNQIHPHFIYNSLSIIRSLAKRDSQRAVSSIDSFSDYLKAHIGAIETDELIDFDKELNNIKVYLELVRADKSRKLDVIYDLKATGFMIPPLSLEPIVENAVNHGISREGGEITVCSYDTDDSYIITVSDNGTARNLPADDKPFHMGVGIENTRKRLELHCGGTLDMDMHGSGTTVTVKIPKSGREKANEGSYSRRQSADS